MGIVGQTQPVPKNVLIEVTPAGEKHVDYSNTTAGNVFNTGAPNITLLWQSVYSFTYTTKTNITPGTVETLSNVPFALTDVPSLSIPQGFTMFAVVLTVTSTATLGLIDQGVALTITAQTPTPGGAIGFNGPIFSGGQTWFNFGVIANGKLYNATSGTIASGQSVSINAWVNISYR